MIEEPSTTESTWAAFCLRHKGFYLLEHEPLYSLDPRLIQDVRAELPDFFTADELAFESDLAATVSVAFSHERAIGDLKRDAELDERIRITSQEINSMLREHHDSAQTPVEALKRGLKRQAAYQARIRDRQEAYKGWLVCNTDFWSEVSKLKADWETVVAKSGFPRLQFWFEILPKDAWPNECIAAFAHFYRGWGLQTMTTWDLPVPIEPDLGQGLQSSWGDLKESGLVVFLPWYLATGEAIDFSEALRVYRDVNLPLHLRPWAAKGTAGRRKLGDRSNRHRYFLHRYLGLVLWSRYRERCRRQQGALDAAFANSLGLRDAQQVSRLRNELGIQFTIPKSRLNRYKKST